MMKWQKKPPQAYIQCYPGAGSPVWQAVGIVLIALGLLLLFICIPGWAWAAAAGILLILAGYLLLRLNCGR